MAGNKRDFSIDRAAVKALVAVYGPREAARQAGINESTVLAWSRRYKWKKAAFIAPMKGLMTKPSQIPTDPGMR